jgi:PAS domain S-box-containing protein
VSVALTDDFFSSVIDAAPDGIVVVDAHGTITFANRQASELFGMAHEGLVGSLVDQLLPENLRTIHRAHRLRYGAEPTVRPMGVDLLLRARRGDGTEFPVEVSLSPLRDAGTVSVVVAVRDVTARVEAEESMRRVLLTLDATEDAVFIMDAESLRFSYVNDGASRQVGYGREELIGMTLMHINPDLSEAELGALIEGVVAADQSSAAQSAVSLPTTHRRRDGRDVPVEMNLQVAPAGRDGRVPIIAVARDISSRLEAESQMRLSEDALRHAEQVVAIADDRERIARELHDTVIQRLFASGLALQAAMTRVDAEIAGRLDSIVSDLDQTIGEIRTAIFALETPHPSDAGLRGKILDIVREASDSLGHEPRLHFDGPIETTAPQVAEQLLPTLREALTNVAKHAHAAVTQVNVEIAGGALTLEVIDNGCGVGDVIGTGHGLQNLATRAARLGGALTVEPTQPSGTTLRWTVPR